MALTKQTYIGDAIEVYVEHPAATYTIELIDFDILNVIVVVDNEGDSCAQGAWVCWYSRNLHASGGCANQQAHEEGLSPETKIDMLVSCRVS